MTNYRRHQLSTTFGTRSRIMGLADMIIEVSAADSRVARAEETIGDAA